MDRRYDLFEQYPDGSFMWRAAIVGRAAAIEELYELGKKSSHEFFAMHLATKEVIARVNASNSKAASG